MFREFDYDNKPVVEIVDEIIDDAVNKGVSDIHFDPDLTGIKVRMRIDGDLHDYCHVPDSVKRNLTTRVKIISGMNITEMRLPQDGAIKKMYGDQQVDMRVSSLPTIHGEKVVIRILDYSRSLAGLETLGFSEHNLKLIQKVIGCPNGIILVAGATGSGKSTTVYSILSRLNQPEKNIITVEDPVEMKMAGLNQVQVMADIGLDFNATLRSILRQDPDTIMIGEIRDGETARIAVRASITGHLVLSTIHTNNSLNTIERLLDMDVERYLLGTSLNGIISQRLCKALCPKCRKKRPTTAYEKNLFDKVLHKQVDEIYEAVGCPECFSGYKSRVAVHEVLILNQDVRDAITNNMRKEDLRKLVYNGKDTFSLLEDGLEKVITGDTDMQEVLRVISVEDDFGEGDDDLKKAFIGSDLAETSMETTPSTPEKDPSDVIPMPVNIPKEEPKAEETIETPVDNTTATPVTETPTETVEAPKEEEKEESVDIVPPEVNMDVVNQNPAVSPTPDVPKEEPVKEAPVSMDIVPPVVDMNIVNQNPGMAPKVDTPVVNEVKEAPVSVDIVPPEVDMTKVNQPTETITAPTVETIPTSPTPDLPPSEVIDML